MASLGRRVDALTAAVAAEVADRSLLGSRENSLAHRAGFGSPGRLVAASSGGTVGRASVLMAVGRSTAARRSLAGEVLPSVHPHVASGLHDGAVSLEAAHLIVGMLDRVRSLVTPDMLDHTVRMGAGANGPGVSGKVWFIPPAFVDPDRRPRPGVQRQSLREKGRRTDEAEGTGDIGT